MILKTKAIVIILSTIFFPLFFAKGSLAQTDADYDGLPDLEEVNIFKTDPDSKDTDGDGFLDGDEVANSYDPNRSGNDKLEKTILVSINSQVLEYYLGQYQIGQFKVSTGKKGFDTPKGDYSVIIKKPVVNYRGAGYNYPGTKWNLMFKKGSWGNYYIHGAYWHNNFGQVMSHGCVNVSYDNMEKLFNWAENGVKVQIR